MSRDSFDFDEFRDSWESEWDRESHTLESFGFGRNIGRGKGGSFSDPAMKLLLEKFGATESASDRALAAERERQEMKHTTAPQDPRETASLDERNRIRYTDRDRSYLLRSSEIHTLTEVGTFRVINQDDLASFAYAADKSRFETDIRNLHQQGLLERRGTSPFKKESQRVFTLTQRGRRLLRANKLVPDDQAIYSGFVKPKEAAHDAALYRLYQRVAAEIESKGGKTLRVQLDYELKEKLWRKLGQARLQDKTEAFHLKQGYAQQMYLPVVDGKVSFPDLRIEYANQDMEISRVDLELATGHYHAGHLSEKARSGFQIYARPEDAAGLRRVRDEREIMTSIMSL